MNVDEVGAKMMTTTTTSVLDMDCVRSILTRIASNSVSLLDARKYSRMACSTISQVETLSCKPMPAPVWREMQSTLIIHQPLLS